MVDVAHLTQHQSSLIFFQQLGSLPKNYAHNISIQTSDFETTSPEKREQ